MRPIRTALIALTIAAMPPFAVQAQEGSMARSTIKGNPVAACGHMTYVANSVENTISVIDLKTERILNKFSMKDGPNNPTFTRDWTKVYVAISGETGKELGILDAKTGKLLRYISAGRTRPSGLRFTPDNKSLIISYIGAKTSDAGALGKMNVETGKLDWLIEVGAQSERFDITPDGKRAYVANLGSQSITVVDLDQGKIIETIKSPEPLPFNVIVSPKGLRAYVANVRGATILEIDTQTNKVIKTIKTAPGPNGMTFTPDGDNFLVTTVYGGRLQSYNLSSGVVSDGSFVGLLPGFVRLAPDGLKGMLARPYGRAVSIFDGTTLEVTKNIETGVGPATLAICGNP